MLWIGLMTKNMIINNGDIVAVKVFFSLLNTGKSRRRPVLVIGHGDGTLTFLALTLNWQGKRHKK